MIKLKELIKESKYAFSRKFGEPLPTLETSTEKHKVKKVNEGGMGILTSDQSDVLQGIVMRNKNKNIKAILKVAIKSGYFKNVDKKELLGYIDGAKQFVKYMKSHPMESVNEARSTNREWNKFEKAFGDFFTTVLRLGKANTKLTGNKTDEKIFIKNFNRDVGKFYSLMQSWVRGQNESVNEELQNSQGEQTDFKKGDLVKDINPDCPHHGSEGEVTKVGKGTITFDVSNNGKNYQQGDELEKTVDQMVKLKESVNEGFTKYHIRLTDTPGWYGVWDKKGKQKFEGDKKFVMKHLKKLKTRMGNFQLKSLIGVATKRKGKDIEFDVVESVNEYHKFRGKMTYGDKEIGEEGMRFFLDQLINSMEHYDEREFVRHMGKELGLDKKIMKRIWKNYDKVHASFRDKWTDRHWEKWLNKQGITEDTKRDYKAEYKKYGSSTKAKKYRAELNQYNRKKGTYGNNDGKDASHKGGKIVGFEKESTNRGRREKSRLKKEDIREFSGDQGINVYLGGIVNSLQKAGIKAKTAKQMKHGFSKSRDKIGFFIDVLDRKREKYTLQLEIDRDGNLWYLSAPRDMKLGKWADTSKVVRSLKAISKLPDFGQSSLNRR